MLEAIIKDIVLFTNYLSVGSYLIHLASESRSFVVDINFLGELESLRR